MRLAQYDVTVLGNSLMMSGSAYSMPLFGESRPNVSNTCLPATPNALPRQIIAEERDFAGVRWFLH